MTKSLPCFPLSSQEVPRANYLHGPPRRPALYKEGPLLGSAGNLNGSEVLEKDRLCPLR